MNLKHEAKVLWDMAKTAWSVIPLKCKYAVYGGLVVAILLGSCGAASAENAPKSNFGFIGTPAGNITYACYVSDASVGAPPMGVVYTCLILEARGPGIMASSGAVAYCVREAVGTYSCGTYEDMRKIATGI